MGIFTQVSNRKRTKREKHVMQWKRQVKASKKAAKGPTFIDVEDGDLFSPEMMRNKLKNPRNNIALSNKKRKRILKRLKHQQIIEREKDEDEEEEDCEMAQETEKPAEKQSDATSTAPSTAAATVVTDSKTSQPATSSSSQAEPTAASKKKRRKRKRGKGSAAAANTEDVEMKEDD